MTLTPFFSREAWAQSFKPAIWLARRLDNRHLFVGRPKFKVGKQTIEVKSVKGDLSSLLKWVDEQNSGDSVIAVYTINMVDGGVVFDYLDPSSFKVQYLDVPVVREASFTLRYAVIPPELLAGGVEVAPVALELHPDDSDVFTKAEFTEMCKCGGIINSDGCGNLATSTGIAQDYRVDPYSVAAGEFKWPEWATHVVWFNK